MNKKEWEELKEKGKSLKKAAEILRIEDIKIFQFSTCDSLI